MRKYPLTYYSLSYHGLGEALMDRTMRSVQIFKTRCSDG